VGDKYYQNAKVKTDWSDDVAEVDEDDEAAATPHEVKLEKRYSCATKSTVDILDERLIPYELIVRLLERLCFEDMSCIHFSAAILVFMPGIAEIRRLHDILSDHPLFGVEAGFRILPLHSTMSSDNQAAVFDLLPPGIRKIVICELLSFVKIRFIFNSLSHEHCRNWCDNTRHNMRDRLR
jgi:ATP-dependent RNA helicase DHX29